MILDPLLKEILEECTNEELDTLSTIWIVHPIEEEMLSLIAEKQKRMLYEN